MPSTAARWPTTSPPTRSSRPASPPSRTSRVYSREAACGRGRGGTSPRLPAARPRPLGNGRDAGRRRHAVRARRLGWELRRATREPCDGRFRIGRCFCHALSRETVLLAKKEPVWQSSEAFRGAFRKDASRKTRSSFWAARCRLPNRLFFGRRGRNRRQVPAFRAREGGLWFRQRTLMRRERGCARRAAGPSDGASLGFTRPPRCGMPVRALACFPAGNLLAP